MKALVTGASGFIGSHIVDRLQEEGHEVTAFVRPTSDTSHLEKAGARLAYGDITDLPSLEEAAKGQDWVFHTAAIVATYGSWKHYKEVGVDGTVNAIKAAVRGDASRFIHLGSIAVYGTRPSSEPFTEDTPWDENPERWNHYVREKVWSERRVWRAHHRGMIPVTSLRPSIVLGSRDRNAVPRVIAVHKSPLGGIVGDGQNRVPCVTIGDVAEATVKAASTEAAAGRAYNLSGKDPITQREFMDSVAHAAGLKTLGRSFPAWMGMASSTAIEGISGLLRRPEPAVNRIVVALGGRDYEIDCSRAAEDLGFKGDGDYDEAIRQGVAWYLAREA